jgi:hypothetical protein
VTPDELAWSRFEMAWNHLNSEIQIIWTRFSAFLIIEAALIAFAAPGDDDLTTGLTWVLKVGVCLFGVIVSVIWWGVTHASLQWLEHWRYVAYRREQDLDGITDRDPTTRTGVPDNDLTFLWKSAEPMTSDSPWEKDWRPTRIAAWTPPLLALLWVGLGVFYVLAHRAV